MKHLGLYTGRLYTQKDIDDAGRRPECTIKLTDEEARDEQYIKARYVKIHTWCTECKFRYCIKQKGE